MDFTPFTSGRTNSTVSTAQHLRRKQIEQNNIVQYKMEAWSVLQSVHINVKLFVEDENDKKKTLVIL